MKSKYTLLLLLFSSQHINSNDYQLIQKNKELIAGFFSLLMFISSPTPTDMEYIKKEFCIDNIKTHCFQAMFILLPFQNRARLFPIFVHENNLELDKINQNKYLFLTFAYKATYSVLTYLLLKGLLSIKI